MTLSQGEGGEGQRFMIVIIIDENDDDSGRPLKQIMTKHWLSKDGRLGELTVYSTCLVNLGLKCRFAWFNLSLS